MDSVIWTFSPLAKIFKVNWSSVEYVRADVVNVWLGAQGSRRRHWYPAQIQTARDAVENNDPATLQKVGHSLKGALGNLAAPTGSKIASELESMAKTGNMTLLTTKVAELEKESVFVVQALEDLCLEIELETGAVPAYDPLGLHNHQSLLPAGPKSPKNQPEDRSAGVSCAREASHSRLRAVSRKVRTSRSYDRRERRIQEIKPVETRCRISE